MHTCTHRDPGTARSAPRIDSVGLPSGPQHQAQAFGCAHQQGVFVCVCVCVCCDFLFFVDLYLVFRFVDLYVSLCMCEHMHTIFFPCLFCMIYIHIHIYIYIYTYTYI